jgi:hypothetical protein
MPNFAELEKLFGRKRRQLKRWQAAGVNLEDLDAVTAYAKEQDLKVVGASRNRALKRMSQTGQQSS